MLKIVDRITQHLANKKHTFIHFYSDILEISTSVPQGSVLVPPLFSIYVNDISKASQIFDFISYADDKTFSSQIHCFEDASASSNNKTIILYAWSNILLPRNA